VKERDGILKSKEKETIIGTNVKDILGIKVIVQIASETWTIFAPCGAFSSHVSVYVTFIRGQKSGRW